ncbi:MAG: hypothetical protein IKD61_02285 [Oscillospiraceae bacterium]|nr:hypothetical protein [Oscillospiraceae bacterium]
MEENTPVTQSAPATFTEEQVKAMIAEAVAKATAEAKVQTAPQIVQLSAETERVHFLWQAEVSDENIFEVGPNGMYGRIIGKTGSFYVPKSDLSRVMDAMFRLLLQKRWIIAVDGLTDEEREAYGVAYNEGELLDKKGFAKMVELGNEMLIIYPKLCKGHREMVAKRYHEAYANRSQYVTREIVVELNRLSKQLRSKDGDFRDIIESMNDADLK